MIDERVFLGFPKNFDNLCKIYPPKIKDVVGNDKFPDKSGSLQATAHEYRPRLFFHRPK